MAFASEQDLLKYVPDALNYGVNNWDSALADAELDIQKLIKARWFDKEMGVKARGDRLSTVGVDWDPTRLDDTQWMKSCVYRALAEYIMPQLANFRTEGDAFREQISYYRDRFEREFNIEMEFGVRYDLDNDGEFEKGERFEVDQGRLYR